MGTRNLTVVILNKEVKVAQYGQWDGNPRGQGETIASFLREKDLGIFKEKVGKLSFFTEQELQAFDGVAMEALQDEYPQLSRDEGANILNIIDEKNIKKVINRSDFKENGLFCEYCYEIDLDKEEVIISGGINITLPFQEFTKERMEELEEGKLIEKELAELERLASIDITLLREEGKYEIHSAKQQVAKLALRAIKILQDNLN